MLLTAAYWQGGWCHEPLIPSDGDLDQGLERDAAGFGINLLPLVELVRSLWKAATGHRPQSNLSSQPGARRMRNVFYVLQQDSMLLWHWIKIHVGGDILAVSSGFGTEAEARRDAERFVTGRCSSS